MSTKKNKKLPLVSSSSSSVNNKEFVRVNFSYIYDHKGKHIEIFKGEVLRLSQKTNLHWWKCLREGEKKSFYVPALYVSAIRRKNPGEEDDDDDDDEEEEDQEEDHEYDDEEEKVQENQQTSRKQQQGGRPHRKCRNFEFDGDLEFDGEEEEVVQEEKDQHHHHHLDDLTDEDNLHLKTGVVDHVEEEKEEREEEDEDDHNYNNNNENHNYGGDQDEDEEEEAEEEEEEDDESQKYNNNKPKNDNNSGGVAGLIENDGEKIRIRTSMNVSSDLEDENQSFLSIQNQSSLSSIPSAIVPDIQFNSRRLRLQNDRLLGHSDSYSSIEETKRLTKGYWSESLEELSSQIVFPGQPNNVLGQSKNLCFRNPSFTTPSNISKSDSSIKLSRDENLDSLVTEEPTPKPENLVRALPNGWAEYKCPSSSRVFYYNSATKNTSWKPPRISKEDNNNIFNVPTGWTQMYDDISGTVSFISQATGAKWFSSTDPSGKIYFYEENSSKSSWLLPAEEAAAGGGQASTSSASSSNLQHQRLESISSGDSSEVDLVRTFPKRNFSGEHLDYIVDRGTKTRSLLLLDSRKHVEESSKAASLPRQLSIWRNGKSAQHTIYENYLNRTKVTENGKKVRKNWTTSWAVLTRTHLTFFKDQKALTADHIKSDMEVDLLQSRVEWTKDKSSKKYVFELTCPSLQLLCQSNSEVEAEKWFNYINKQITNLPEEDEIRYHLKASSPPKNSSDYGEVYTGDGTFKPQRRNTTKSLTKVRITTTKDDDKNQIRNQLKKFFIRRQSRDSLIKKGIYKDEPVFGCTLEKLTQLEGTTVPLFVENCIAIIESKPENMKTDGIYRASGNLCQVQKIRLQVDQNNLSILLQEDDVHVLAGSLKLFFREMREPVVPSNLFQHFLKACHIPQKEEKLKKFRELIQQLPRPNYDTLKKLLQHLLEVSSYSEYNRMQIPNLAIVFGPTVMWSNSESNLCMAADLMQQNYVVEFILTEFHTLFH